MAHSFMSLSLLVTSSYCPLHFSLVYLHLLALDHTGTILGPGCGCSWGLSCHGIPEWCRNPRSAESAHPYSQMGGDLLLGGCQPGLGTGGSNGEAPIPSFSSFLIPIVWELVTVWNDSKTGSDAWHDTAHEFLV